MRFATLMAVVVFRRRLHCGEVVMKRRWLPYVGVLVILVALSGRAMAQQVDQGANVFSEERAFMNTLWGTLTTQGDFQAVAREAGITPSMRPSFQLRFVRVWMDSIQRERAVFNSRFNDIVAAIGGPPPLPTIQQQQEQEEDEQTVLKRLRDELSAVVNLLNARATGGDVAQACRDFAGEKLRIAGVYVGMMDRAVPDRFERAVIDAIRDRIADRLRGDVEALSQETAGTLRDGFAALRDAVAGLIEEPEDP